jgi:hypothetical protein
LQLAVGYLNATRYSKTLKPELGIELTSLANAGKTYRLTHMGPGSAPQDAADRGFGRGWIQSQLFQSSGPGPIASTTPAVANVSFIVFCNQSPLRLPKIQKETLLTLH